MKKILAGLGLCLLCCFLVFAQTEDNSETPTEDAGEFGFEDDDSFGFGDDAGATSSESAFSLKFGGDLHAGINFCFEDFKNISKASPRLPVWGGLHISATAPLTEAYFGVDLNDKTLPIKMGPQDRIAPKPMVPSWIEQAYMQVIAGPVVLGGGVKKLTWGRADAMSVLDIVNPRDYSDLSELEPEKQKIAAPMFYLSAYLPKEMKLDLVYLPVFEPNKMAMTGRWKAFNSSKMMEKIPAGLVPAISALIPGGFTSENIERLMLERLEARKTNRLDYAQAGLRYTVTINGFHDLGLQYFCGFLPNPALKFNYKIDERKIFAEILQISETAKKKAEREGKTEAEQLNAGMAAFQKAMTDVPAREIAKMFTSASFQYNRYHQIGMDYAAALGPVNLRAELAANITSDLKGDDPSVYNPNIAWNLGFDYTMPYSIMLNIQVFESIRLKQKAIDQGERSFDIEKDTKTTDTRLMIVLSQRLVRGSLEWRLIGLVGIEDADFMISPGLHWQFGTLLMDLDLGFFGGKKTGKFGQFHKNHFIKLSIGYKF